MSARYPLAAALELRERAKEDARRALGDALRAIEVEQRKLAEREQERELLVADREDRNSRLYDVDESGMLSVPLIEKRRDALRYLDARIEEAAKAIDAQREAVKAAEARAEERRTELVEADQGLRAVEKHREDWLEERKKEAARKDQRQAEEIVLARYAAETAALEETGE
jgi:flagellar biosynthesis chaperone FliJ